MKFFQALFWTWAILFVQAAVAASPDEGSGNLLAEWGGHLRLRGGISRPDDRSLYQRVGTGTYLDGSGEFRFKNQIFFADWGSFETHYEAVLLGGETWQKGRALQDLTGGRFEGGIFAPEIRPLSDDRRLMDLTHVIDEGADGVLYHRLDRLFLTVERPWGIFRIGRQAVTWGNGMVFNPMDLFNPFAPTDVVRDYKVGDDMALLILPAGENGDFRAIGVPRRNPENGIVEWDASAVGAKLRIPLGGTEWTLLAARSYDNLVAGAGAVGYAWSAVWRVDATWTTLPAGGPSGGYLSAVANVDVSWTLWDKNFYGFLELYFNGLGETDYSDVFDNPDLLAAVARGEIFTLGRLYLTPDIGVEVHPLFNVHVTFINNLPDPSGAILPRCVWSITEDMEAMIGATLHWGEEGSEYGGFSIPGLDARAVPVDGAYVWLTWYY